MRLVVFMRQLKVNPYLGLARYGGGHYVYDRRQTYRPLVEFPTRKLDPQAFEALERLQGSGILADPRPEDEIKVFLEEEQRDPALLEQFVERRYLNEHQSRTQALQKRVLHSLELQLNKPAPEPELAEQPAFHAETNYFSHATFFNLPADIAPDACHVGILGLPHASLELSLGTEAGPHALRAHTRRYSWLDVYQQGVYSEINCRGNHPEILGRGVVLGDFGDLDFSGMSVLEMLVNLRHTLQQKFIAPQVLPFLIGGDHAITAPVVECLLEEMPDLGLLHLDAHNDLFYTQKVSYNHAAPISNLLKRTDLQRVLSFGLRSFAEDRARNMRAICENPAYAERVRLYSLISTRQLMATPELLATELARHAERPYYLTIDLDVLSEDAIGRQLSTPAGPGLEWHELFYFLEAAFKNLNIVACDIVEYNPISDATTASVRPGMIKALLVQIIDRLAQNSPKPRPDDTAISQRE